MASINRFLIAHLDTVSLCAAAAFNAFAYWQFPCWKSFHGQQRWSLEVEDSIPFQAFHFYAVHVK